MSWYTKWAILSTVFVSTELYMLTDQSEHFKDTQEFLDWRCADVLDLGSNINFAWNLASALHTGGESIISIFKPESESKEKIESILNLQKEIRDQK